MINVLARAMESARVFGIDADAADVGRPIRAFFDTIDPAKQVVFKTFIADRISVEKLAVVQSLADEHMREAEHRRDVGAR